MRADPAGTDDADICLIVEGAYPYVVGGVSAWLQDLVAHLPDIRFALVAIKPTDAPLPFRLQPPANIVSIVEVPLAPATAAPRPLPAALVAAVADALVGFLATGQGARLHALIAAIHPLDRPRPADILAHPALFARLRSHYSAILPTASFHHYFWAMRTLLGGVLAVLLAPLPRARGYHTISTGFAGLMAARAVHETGRPAAITEHGIYLLERQIEVMMADWIGDQVDTGLDLEHPVRDLRDLWVRAFTSYAAVCYDACDPIVALYQDNGVVQRRLGADPARLRVVPNGIDARRFAALRDARDPDRPLVALIGRVVPIKDVKTFIRAAAIVHAARSDVRFAVLGPADEDPDYAAECERLVDELDLRGVFAFAGRVDLRDWMARIDLVVLTSLSEAQPLVILEAGACAIPVVAPDVGSCREMIEGRGDAPGARGEAHGGIVTALVDPAGTAAAMDAILGDPTRRARMGAALRARVLADYDHDSIIGSYRDMYADFIAR